MARFDAQEATKFAVYAMENPDQWYVLSLDMRLDVLLTGLLAVLIVTFSYGASSFLPGRK